MGQDFIKKIRVPGCILFAGLMVVFLLFAFTSGRAPIKGYDPPQSSEYYAQHTDELRTELETNVFPYIDGVAGCEAGDGVLKVTLEADRYVSARSDILHYYDKSLFEFIKGQVN